MNRDLNYEDLTTGAIHSCGGPFHFFQESKNRVVELRAVAVKALHSYRDEACVKSEDTGAELFVAGGIVQLGGREVHQRQRPHRATAFCRLE